jgi:hypothetical protein
MTGYEDLPIEIRDRIFRLLRAPREAAALVFQKFTRARVPHLAMNAAMHYESMYYSSRGLGDFRHILGQLTQNGPNSRRERRNFYTYLLRRDNFIAFRMKWHSRDEYTQHQPVWLPMFQ